MAPKAVATICLAVLLHAFTGCVTSKAVRSAERQDRLLQGHNFEDLRVSTEAAEGMIATGVWRLRGARNVIYLAATTHLVTANQVPFPSSYYAAYRDSDVIYLEVTTDSSNVSEFRLGFQMMKWLRKRRADFFYPKGQTLADELNPQTLSRLKEFYGRDYNKMLAMRPVFLAFMIQAQGLGEQFLEEGGVEDVFAARARIDRKPIRELDDSSVNDVVLLALDEMIYDFKRQLEKDGADAVINEALSGSEEPIDERSWRNGDLLTTKAEIDEMRSQAPELYEKIGPERNRKWLRKILAALKTDKNALVLAGVAHFPGPDGLIALLQGAGYGVEQLFGVDPRR
jgi:uncharacterized protein